MTDCDVSVDCLRTQDEAAPAGQEDGVELYPCRVFFWQPAEGDSVRIGLTTGRNNTDLRQMVRLGRTIGLSSPRRLSVIDGADGERWAEITRTFEPHRLPSDRRTVTRTYRPDPGLLAFIDAQAIPWRSSATIPRRGKAGPPVEIRSCDACDEAFATNRGDNYCGTCKSRRLAQGGNTRSAS